MTWFQGRPPDQSTSASWSTSGAKLTCKLVGTIWRKANERGICRPNPVAETTRGCILAETLLLWLGWPGEMSVGDDMSLAPVCAPWIRKSALAECLYRHITIRSGSILRNFMRASLDGSTKCYVRMRMETPLVGLPQTIRSHKIPDTRSLDATRLHSSTAINENLFHLLVGQRRYRTQGKRGCLMC